MPRVSEGRVMSAIISECGKYRYLLQRDTPNSSYEKGTCLFVMLNPSTADANQDDPTIRRCIGFAETWGCAGLVVANLYAYRATDPKELKKADDPIGVENDKYLTRLAMEYDDVVFACGANAEIERLKEVLNIFESKDCRSWCLGVTKSGYPKHPLYIKRDQPLVRFKGAS